MTIPWEKLELYLEKWVQKNYEGFVWIHDFNVITSDEYDGELPSDRWLCQFEVYGCPHYEAIDDAHKICSRYEWVLESELGEE